MSTLTLAAADSVTMLRRNLLHARRYPSLTLIVAIMPIIFLVLFVYVFGGTLGAGLAGAGGPAGGGGRSAYLEYVVPGILVIALTGAAQGTAIGVAMDMTEGIVARFRTMDISRAAVLTGHVAGSVIQALIGLVVVFGAALAIGFRPGGGVAGVLLAFGVLALIAFALTWISVTCGMAAKTVEGASNLPMPLILLPFFGSGFVPTDSMPAGLRWFAEVQPFTPFIETVRAALNGSNPGLNWLWTLLWCAGLSAAGYLGARTLYARRSVVG